MGFLSTGHLINSLLCTLLLVGTILMAATVLVSTPSLYLRTAGALLAIGIFSFALSLQFLITASEQAWADTSDPRLAFSFITGYVAYGIAIALMAIHLMFV